MKRALWVGLLLAGCGPGAGSDVELPGPFPTDEAVIDSNLNSVDYPGAIPIFTAQSRVFGGQNSHQFIVIHSTATPGVTQAQDIAHYFQTTPLETSVHYVVGRDGAVVQVVAERDGAGGNCCLEAGHDSIWPTNTNLNVLTLSIEFVNPTSDNSLAPTAVQAQAGFKLVDYLARKYHIDDRHILGHNTIDPISREKCPGNFPWKGLFDFLHARHAVQMGRHLANNADGRLEVFYRGVDGHAGHLWQTSANGGWHAFESFLGSPAREPSLGTNADGRLEAFVVGSDRNLYHRWQQSTGWTTDWVSLGEGQADSDPAVILDAAGKLGVYVKKGDGHIAYLSQTLANGVWGHWLELNPVAVKSRPAVGRNSDGRLEVFAVGANDTLVHTWQSSAGTWGPNTWSPLGTMEIQGNPVVSSNADGRLEVFAVSTDSTLWHIAQKQGGGWSEWMPFKVIVNGDVAVGRNADGRMEVFARSGNNQLWHAWQLSPNSGWSTGGAFPDTHVFSNPDVGANADGRLQVFYLCDRSVLWSLWETPSRGWSTPTAFGGPLASF